MSWRWWSRAWVFWAAVHFAKTVVPRLPGSFLRMFSGGFLLRPSGFEGHATPSPVSDSWRAVRFGAHIARVGHRPRGSQQVMRVTRWIQLNTEPNEPVLFLPNDAAYYYLTDRPNPIRFVMGHQMVSDSHRV